MSSLENPFQGIDHNHPEFYSKYFVNTFKFWRVKHTHEEMQQMPIIFKQYCAHCNRLVLQWVNDWEHFTEIEYVAWKDDEPDAPKLMDQEILCYPCWKAI